MDTDVFIMHIKTEDFYKDMMLKKDLIHQIMTISHRKEQKSDWINER